MKCCEPSLEADHTGLCSTCQSKGWAVEELTVKALLKEVALRRYDPGSYRFCPNADCAIVYFDDAGRTFRKDDLRIAVWQKEPVGSRMICYCFNETEATIRVEIERSGTTNVIQRVRDHIAAGRCACAIRNPRGACCLGDVAETVKRFTSNV